MARSDNGNRTQEQQNGEQSGLLLAQRTHQRPQIAAVSAPYSSEKLSTARVILSMHLAQSLAGDVGANFRDADVGTVLEAQFELLV